MFWLEFCHTCRSVGECYKHKGVPSKPFLSFRVVYIQHPLSAQMDPLVTPWVGVSKAWAPPKVVIFVLASPKNMLWMDETMHHLRHHGKPLLVGIYRGLNLPGLLRWRELGSNSALEPRLPLDLPMAWGPGNQLQESASAWRIGRRTKRLPS